MKKLIKKHLFTLFVVVFFVVPIIVDILRSQENCNIILGIGIFALTAFLIAELHVSKTELSKRDKTITELTRHLFTK